MGRDSGNGGSGTVGLSRRERRGRLGFEADSWSPDSVCDPRGLETQVMDDLGVARGRWRGTETRKQGRGVVEDPMELRDGAGTPLNL